MRYFFKENQELRAQLRSALHASQGQINTNSRGSNGGVHSDYDNYDELANYTILMRTSLRINYALFDDILDYTLLDLLLVVPSLYT